MTFPLEARDLLEESFEPFFPPHVPPGKRDLVKIFDQIPGY